MQEPDSLGDEPTTSGSNRLSAMRLARYRDLEACPTQFLLPIVKLGEEMTYWPWEVATCPAVIVKTQNLLSRNGKTTKPIFDNIQHAGSIHKHLGFDGNVILSSIMPDRAILGFSREEYATMINTLKPDYFITPDGETYSGEEALSEFEIARILEDTKYLLKACPNSKPIGLVKGCNLEQIEVHTAALLGLGITKYVLHAGDFVCRRKKHSLFVAQTFANKIRQMVPWLLVYGAGSNSHFLRFKSASGFATQSHYVSAFYRKKMVGTRWVHFENAPNRRTIMQSLRAMEENLFGLSSQRDLTSWLKPDDITTLVKIKNGKNGAQTPEVDGHGTL